MKNHTKKLKQNSVGRDESVVEMVKIPFQQVYGIKVGHVSDHKNATGCTVLLAENPTGMVCGVDVRGGAPGVLGLKNHENSNIFGQR